MHKQYQAAHFQFGRYIRRRELFSDRNRAGRMVEIREPQRQRNPATIFRFYRILVVSRRCKKRTRY